MIIQIKNYENYGVDENGNVWNLTTMKKLNPYMTSKGYLKVVLSHESRCKQYFVHRLVAEAFVPNPDNLPYINHKDENKLNNNFLNLEWCTQKYNINYGTRTERAVQTKKDNGFDFGRKKVRLVEFDVIFPSIKSASDATGEHKSTIQRICDGKQQKNSIGWHWEYVTENSVNK